MNTLKKIKNKNEKKNNDLKPVQFTFNAEYKQQ